MTGRSPQVRCVVSAAAVAADCADLIYNEPVRTALDRVRAPIHLVRAQRSLFNDDPVLPDPLVDAFAAACPDSRVEMVDGANHYTLIFAAPGPQRIAAAIQTAISAAITNERMSSALPATSAASHEGRCGRCTTVHTP